MLDVVVTTALRPIFSVNLGHPNVICIDFKVLSDNRYQFRLGSSGHVQNFSWGKDFDLLTCTHVCLGIGELTEHSFRSGNIHK